jgi:hypothetical protein
MKDLFKGAQEVQEGFLQNPFSLAGLMMGRGHGNLSFSDAITQSAATIREREQTRINAMEQDRRRQMAAQSLQEDERKKMVLGQLAQAFQANPNITDREALQMLYQNGINPTEAVLKTFRPSREIIREGEYLGQGPSVISTKNGKTTVNPLGENNNNGAPIVPIGIPQGQSSSEGIPKNPAPNPNSNVNKPPSADFITALEEAGHKVYPLSKDEAKAIRIQENKHQLDIIKPQRESLDKQITNIRGLEAALSGFETGRGSESLTGLKQIAKAAGFNPKDLTSRETAEKFMKDFVLEEMKLQKGPQTNQDREFIEKKLPQLSLSPESNKILVEILKRINQRAMAHLDARDDYFEKYRSTEGFEKQWHKVINDDPIITPEIQAQLEGKGDSNNQPTNQLERFRKLRGNQ